MRVIGLLLVVTLMTGCTGGPKEQLDFQVVLRTDDERERDRKALQSLSEAGSDLTRPHPIDHYFYFPNRQQAVEAARTLSREGFSVKGSAAPDNSSFTLVAQKTVIPTEATIFALSDMLRGIAKKYGGEYDGWDAPVLRDGSGFVPKKRWIGNS